MSMCRLVSWVVGKGCLLWSVCSLDKTLFAFALLHFELQGQTFLLFWVSLDFLLFHSNPLCWTRHLFFSVCSRRHCISSYNQLQLPWHQWLGCRFGILWCWMVCLGNKLRSFCSFWDCTQVLHFRFFCWLWGLLHFFQGILDHSSRYDDYLNEIFPFSSILVHWFLGCWCSLLSSPAWPHPTYLDSWA